MKSAPPPPREARWTYLVDVLQEGGSARRRSRVSARSSAARAVAAPAKGKATTASTPLRRPPATGPTHSRAEAALQAADALVRPRLLCDVKHARVDARALCELALELQARLADLGDVGCEAGSTGRADRGERTGTGRRPGTGARERARRQSQPSLPGRASFRRKAMTVRRARGSEGWRRTEGDGRARGEAAAEEAFGGRELGQGLGWRGDDVRRRGGGGGGGRGHGWRRERERRGKGEAAEGAGLSRRRAGERER